METRVEWIRLDGWNPAPPKGVPVLAFWPDGDISVEENRKDGPGFCPGYSPGGMAPIAWAGVPGAGGWNAVGGPRDHPEPGRRVLARYAGGLRVDTVYARGGGGEALWLNAGPDGALPEAWLPLPSPPDGWEDWNRLIDAEALGGILAREMECLRADMKREGPAGDAAAAALAVLRDVDGLIRRMPTRGHCWEGWHEAP